MIGEIVSANIKQSIEVHARLLTECLETISAGADALVAAYRSGHKALFFGNGGSAADAQHLAAEFLGRYLREREPMPALALHEAHGVVADAIDREYREIGAADQARQQGHAVLDAAVMVEECTAGAFHQGLELRHLIGPATDVKHLRAAEVRRGG